MATISLDLKQISATGMQLVNPDWNIVIDRPTSKGGGGAGLMGGQHLLMGIAGCFCSTLFAAAQSREVTITNLTVQVNATMSATAPKRFESVAIEIIQVNCSPEDELEKLLIIAEKGCISLNTVKQGLSISINQKASVE